MRRHTKTAWVTVVALTVGGVVAGTAAATAAFSDTAPGVASEAEAATVELDRSAAPVELDYTDLRPGRTQVSTLALPYEGGIPADLTLEIAASGSSAFCTQRNGQWHSGGRGSVTLTVGSAASVDYCELLNGRALSLATAVLPGSQRRADIAVMLSSGISDDLRGVTERGVATVRARNGGFTDHTVGTISISTAARDLDESGQPSGDTANRHPDPTNPAAPALSPDPPAAEPAPTVPITQPASPAEPAPAEPDHAPANSVPSTTQTTPTTPTSEAPAEPPAPAGAGEDPPTDPTPAPPPPQN